VVQDVYDHLQEIEDVRPLRSVVGWLTRVKSQARWRSTSHSGVILKSIQKVARTLLPRMLALSTSRKWVWRRIRRDVGIVAKLYAVTVLFRFLPLGAISRILGVLDRIGGLLQTRDPNVTAALGALGGEGERVVFGHTHDFAHVPLHVTGGGARVYLNSGTWRTRVHQAADRSGYLRAKDMTYLVFYEPDESAGGAHKGASYETWNGVMRKRA
jgi:hypothetical protein